MFKNKIESILKKGEGISVEFKKATDKLPSNLFETISAFLNREGGEILLGIDDDKNIIGVSENLAESFCKQIANTSNNPQLLFPSFLIHANEIEFRNKKLIYIYVPISSQIHKFKGKIYDRSADGDFVLSSDDQIKQAYIRKSAQYSENIIYPFLEQTDFAVGIVDRVRKIIRIYRPDHPWNELNDMEFFKTSGLYRKDLSTGKEGFTMSALLLFGKDEVIQSAIPHYKIDALVRKENLDRYDDRDNIRCNLVEAYDRLMAFVAKHLPDKFYLQNDQRISLRDKIFREIIANILIHREYTNAFPSTFIIYNDRVETKNANKPHVHRLLKPGNFEPHPKNPHIAQIFTQMGRSEELGTGVNNVFKYSHAYSGNNNIIFKEEDTFITIVPLLPEREEASNDVVDNVVDNVTKDVTKDVTDNVTDNVTDREHLILVALNNNNKTTTSQLAEAFNVTKRTIIRDIEKLKQKKIITRIGDEKTGYWKVLK